MEKALSRIEGDIAAGDYGRARDRLHGLLATYPDDLTLRFRLGDIYWRLQFPAMAGRYWYLEEAKTPLMTAACRAFERSCGHDPLQILLALRFRGDVEALRNTFAGDTLLALQARAGAERGTTVQFGKKGVARYRGPGSKPIGKGAGHLWGWGCILAALLALGLMIIGLTTVLRWLL